MNTKTTSDSFRITLEIRQKHGVLLAAKKEKGWTNTELGEYLGLSPQTVSSMLNLRYVPRIEQWSRNRRNRFEEQVMELTGKTFDDLFPAQIRTKEFLGKKKATEIFADIPLDHLLPASEEALLLSAPQDEWANREAVEVALSLLEPRERQIVEMYFLEGRTFDEIAQSFGISTARVEQIAKAALRKLRSVRNMRTLNPDELGTFLNHKEKEDPGWKKKYQVPPWKSWHDALEKEGQPK